MAAFASSFLPSSVLSPAAPIAAAARRRTGPVMAAPWNEALRQSTTKQYVSAAGAGLGGGPSSPLTPPTTTAFTFSPPVSAYAKKNHPGLAFEDVAGGPTKVAADNYMAASIAAQYRAVSGTHNGVYSPQCTEATVRGDAEYSRVLALGAEFRRKQRSVAAKYNALYDTRAKAIIAAHNCSHEEAQFCKFPASAYAHVKAGQEARATCVRYAAPESPEEDYMARSIDLQMLRRAVPFGVFEACYDGSTGDLVERARVMGLGRKFTNGWMSANRKEQIKYDARKHAEAMVGHECDAEAALFAMPAIAQSMRPYSTHM
eukprot:CAMPEP_0198310960 /NCGR_PEP_ID=MMETSP1450-20131203/2848_1 /TAXON_ID=753684 ORGANISM="Madagascaria erythrocladiodes, Strain CCMP3234" /NCGR_SAMPLE_ID=MMETSP1450 /ASSEMBLY_ACC=CAM_ASM_001115 /LENGTH=315 /DNA_ID=CAMNT_0044013815 /DNA_START=80 /DNA_END=1027 /DNA_ORIENTATION=-